MQDGERNLYKRADLTLEIRLVHSISHLSIIVAKYRGCGKPCLQDKERRRVMKAFQIWPFLVKVRNMNDVGELEIWDKKLPLLLV